MGIGDYYSINITEKDIIRFTNKQKLTDRPINLIWYCFKGSRFEESEDLLLKKIKDLNLPVLLVYTQAVLDLIKIERFKDKGYDYVKIIAKDMDEYIKSYGLDKLKLKSNEMINNNSKTNFKDIIIVQNINSSKKEIFIYNIKSIRNKIQEIKENYINKFINENNDNLSYKLLNIQ